MLARFLKSDEGPQGPCCQTAAAAAGSLGTLGPVDEVKVTGFRGYGQGRVIV